MKILCDRCEDEMTDFGDRKDWKHIETSEKGYGKLGDYYLCPKCSKEFYNFIDNRRAADER